MTPEKDFYVSPDPSQSQSTTEVAVRTVIRLKGGQVVKNEPRPPIANLDALPFPRLVVPGNHDVPLFNVFTRFFTPLARYRHVLETASARLQRFRDGMNAVDDGHG